MKYLILLSGKINSGKNQYAMFLKNQFTRKGLTVREDLYAKDLKDYSVQDFSILGAVLDNKISRIKSSIGMFFDNTNSNMNVQNDIMHQLDELTFHDKNFYEEKTDVTRALLQLYGTNIARKRFDEQFWVKKCAERINEDEDNDVIIITDVRFPNELEDIGDFIDGRVVVPIRIERDIPRDSIAKEHPSETALDDYKYFEFIVDNNGTLQDLLDSSDVVTDDILTNRV